MRLGKEEFERAGELRAGPGPEAGAWLVCNDYRRVGPKGGERYVVPCGDRWRETRPLGEPGLMIELAQIGEEAKGLKDFDEPIIAFVRKRGLLGLSGRVQHGKPTTMRAGEGVARGYVPEIIRATAVVGLYEAVSNGDEDAAVELLANYPRRIPDGERLGDDDRWYEMEPLEHALVELTELVTRRVNEHCYVTAIPPKRSHRVSEVRTGWGFDSLIGAAYLEMYWIIAAEAKIKRCKHCGARILNPRSNQDFCKERDGVNNKCRVDWNYHHGGGKSYKEARKRARQTR